MNKFTHETAKARLIALGISDWEFIDIKKAGGQAHIFEVRNIRTGDIGVFRELKRNDLRNMERFYRDVRILSKFNHPNVIELLDQTTDTNPWYITRKGIPFEDYWEIVREKYTKDPESLLVEAIKIITQLTDGLVGLHECGVVHRDIKTDNVVMIGGVPKLIDFGIAFATNEDRLTPIDDATANRYSPDPALNFMEEVPPWLDVYMLAQLLIWMVSDAHAKSKIHRPLDWRFVRYPFSSKESLNKVRAITASCSDEGVGPKNAGDLKKLIGELFENRKATGGMADLGRIEKIFGMISNGKASNIEKFVSARSSIAARLPLFASLCGDFERELRGMLEDLRKNLPLTITKFESVQEFIRSFQQTSQDALPPVLQSITIEVKYGEEDNLAAFGCCYLLYTAKQIENQPDFKAVEGHPILCFTVNGSNEKLQRSGKTKSYYVIPTNAGTVNLLDDNLRVIKETDIPGVISVIKEAIIDPDVWEIMYQPKNRS